MIIILNGYLNLLKLLWKINEQISVEMNLTYSDNINSDNAADWLSFR